MQNPSFQWPQKCLFEQSIFVRIALWEDFRSTLKVSVFAELFQFRILVWFVCMHQINQPNKKIRVLKLLTTKCTLSFVCGHIALDFKNYLFMLAICIRGLE